MDPCPQIAAPRRFVLPELLRVGIRVVGVQPIRLACLACRAEWCPAIEHDGRIADRYWVCVTCSGRRPE